VAAHWHRVKAEEDAIRCRRGASASGRGDATAASSGGGDASAMQKRRGCESQLKRCASAPRRQCAAAAAASASRRRRCDGSVSKPRRWRAEAAGGCKSTADSGRRRFRLLLDEGGGECLRVLQAVSERSVPYEYFELAFPKTPHVKTTTRKRRRTCSQSSVQEASALQVDRSCCAVSTNAHQMRLQCFVDASLSFLVAMVILQAHCAGQQGIAVKWRVGKPLARYRALASVPQSRHEAI